MEGWIGQSLGRIKGEPSKEKTKRWNPSWVWRKQDGDESSENQVGLTSGLQGPVRQQGCWTWGATGLIYQRWWWPGSEILEIMIWELR